MLSGRRRQNQVLVLLHPNEGLCRFCSLLSAEPLTQVTREYYMVLTTKERTVLRDVLDMQIEEFEDAMHSEAGRKVATSWDNLLEVTGGYAETIQILRSVRSKVTRSDSDG